MPFHAAHVSTERRPQSAVGPGGASGTHVAVLGNFPPRRCGIATFTRDVVSGLAAQGCALTVVAMREPAAHVVYGERVDRTIDASSFEDHIATGRAIAASGAHALLVQHEYGIFGGPSGAWLLDLLDEVSIPVTVTMHTVLARPNDEQTHVLRGLASRAARIVVMADLGRKILLSQGFAPERVVVVPHGAPDRPLADPAALRERLGWEAAPTIATFGLLSPGKGIETVIDALPALRAEVPDVRYALIGATHPHLVAKEGERYREALLQRAHERGVADSFFCVPRYVEDVELLDMLAAADVYVTPYGNPEQITSGTLAYAQALGRPIVSTPYPHARQIVAPERLVPFADPAALASVLGGLLSDPAELRRIATATYERGRSTIWSAVARRTLDLLRETVALGRAAHA